MSPLSDILILALAAYAVTVVVASSYVTLHFRRWFRSTLSLTGSRMFLQWGKVKEDGEAIPLIADKEDRTASFSVVEGFDMISCRLCVGFWMALFVCLCAGHYHWLDVLAVYGLSYAIVTWEKY